MTVGLIIGGLVVIAMAVAGVWLMERAEAEPAARAIGDAPDPGEEEEARTSSVRRSGLLAEREQE